MQLQQQERITTGTGVFIQCTYTHSFFFKVLLLQRFYMNEERCNSQFSLYLIRALWMANEYSFWHKISSVEEFSSVLPGSQNTASEHYILQNVLR